MKPTRRKPVIGLIGGIGSGKSTVAKLFMSLGCGLIDSDDIARRALDQPAVQEKIRAWWGAGVIGADGKVDRRALAAIVFNKPDELARLESLTHPIVFEQRAELTKRYDADPAVVAVVEDTPLLLEKNLDRDCDHLVFIQASRESRLRRVAARGWDEAELARREKNQWPLDMKAQRADDVIVNDAAQNDVLPHVRRVLSNVLHRHAERK